MLALSVASAGFVPPSVFMPQRMSGAVSDVQMSETFGRRAMFQTAAAAAAFGAPFAAFADGATSKEQLFRSRAIYGSRIVRLKDASAEAILEEDNAFTLFTSGAYRSAADKKTTKQLKAIQQTAMAAAGKGDTKGAQAAVGEFIKVGEIVVLDTTEGGNFNPKQRRNPGAPPTSEIEAQMGPGAYALYQPLKPK